MSDARCAESPPALAPQPPAHSPYDTPDDPAGTSTGGITRLRFTAADSGEEIPVTRLRQAILFSVPAPPGLGPAGPGLPTAQAQCAFWAPAEGRFSGDGCAAAPNPLPPGHAAAWPAAAEFDGGAALRAGWSLSGPLLRGCERRAVDCAGSPRRVVFLDSGNPFRGGFSCPPGENGTFVYFTGAECGLWQAENEFGCFWNVTSQAFEGPQCEAQGSVKCGARHRATQQALA